jgi:hypothetical protein
VKLAGGARHRRSAIDDTTVLMSNCSAAAMPEADTAYCEGRSIDPCPAANAARRADEVNE